MRSMFKAKYLIIALAFAPLPANAEGIKALEKGFYLPTDVGCTGIGGAAEIYFDGANISGHYQLCKTTKNDQKNSYKSVCIEAQGPDQPTMADIEKDPDRTTVVQEIDVKSKASFILNKRIYNHCRS